MAEVTSAGLVRTTYAELLSALRVALRDAMDVDFLVDDRTDGGDLTAVFADALDEQEALFEGFAVELDPRQASGSFLEAQAAIRGVERLSAGYSSVVCRVTAPQGTVIETTDYVPNEDGARFFASVETTIGVAGYADITFQAATAGAIEAAAGELDDADGLPDAVTVVTNAAAATPGRLEQTDAELRASMRERSAAIGQSTFDALYTALLEVPGLVEAKIIVNRDYLTDDDGRPPNAVEVVHRGGTAAAVAAAIWAAAGSLGVTFVSTALRYAVTITDAAGGEQEVTAGYAVELTLYADVYLEVGGRWNTDTGPGEVKAAVAAYVEALPIGDDVIQLGEGGGVMGAAADVRGVISVDRVELYQQGETATAEDYPIGTVQKARLDVSRITLHYL